MKFLLVLTTLPKMLPSFDTDTADAARHAWRHGRAYAACTCQQGCSFLLHAVMPRVAGSSLFAPSRFSTYSLSPMVDLDVCSAGPVPNLDVSGIGVRTAVYVQAIAMGA
jgi:hypothetical protein